MARMPSAGAAVLRFHLSVGSRLAMRVLMPPVIAGAGAAYFVGPQTLEALALRLFESGDQGGGSAAVSAALLLGAAATAAPRICRGVGGWLRHLPASGRTHRRAAALAVAVAQVPVVLGLLVLCGIAALAERSAEPLLGRAVGLPLASVAAALAVMPVERGAMARPLALAAALLAAAGTWPWIAAGAALLVAADLAAGPLREPRAAGRPRRLGATGAAFETVVAWRALGWRAVTAPLVTLLPLGAAALFLRNNELAPEHVHLAVRLGGGIGVVLLLADLGEALAVRRPAWPWARSLPWSARRRAAFDAAFLGGHALVAVAVAAALSPLAALALLALLPLLAARAAGAVRRAPERRTGASGEILVEGLLAAAAVALLPWLALALLAATPAALAAAAERERRQKVSRWLELHHLAVGDPQSWSA